MPPEFRINFRAIRILATFDNVSAAIVFKSINGSDKMFTNNGIPSESTIDFWISGADDICANICRAPN